MVSQKKESSTGIVHTMSSFLFQEKKNVRQATALSPEQEEAEPDEVLAELAKTDAEAFGTLYQRYVRQIYKYLYYRTSSATDAEDLTSRTFFQALGALPRYQSKGVPFSAWLFRIAHNLAANWHRDNGRRRIVPLDEENATARSTPDPEHLSEVKEERDELRRVISKLPRDRQQLLFLKFGQEMSNAQIAQMTRKSEGAIKALLHRTITSLRADLVRVRS